jgi:thiol-disulfide isomerase/thioredoxin
MRRTVVIAIGVAVLLVVGILAFGHGGTSANTTPTAFDLPALNGPGRVRIASYKGTPVVVNLFASWCAECQTELPAFARAAHDLRGRVQFIGVDSMETGDGRAMAAQYRLAENGFALARDVGGGGGSGLHDSLKAPGMPVTVFYDASGRELFRDIASLPETTLRQQLHQFYGL